MCIICDLFPGNHCVSPTEGVTHESPMAPLKPDQRYLALPIALALSLAMLTLSLFVPAEYSTEILLSLLFWLGRQSHTVVHSTQCISQYFSHDSSHWPHYFQEWSRVC